MLRAGLGLDLVHRHVRESLNSLVDVALDIASEREVCYSF